MWHRMHLLDLQELDRWLNDCIWIIYSLVPLREGVYHGYTPPVISIRRLMINPGFHCL